MPDPQLAIDLVESWSDLASLREDWDPLLERTRSDVLFLTWAWIEAWYDVMRDTVRPFVLVARDPAGRLRGVAPFYTAPYHLLRFIPCRALRILGDHPSGAEYGDWMVDADQEAEVGAALARGLAARRRSWDFVWMPNVPAFTGARERLLSVCPPAGLSVRERSMEFSAAALPPDYEAFWGALSSNARSSVRRQQRRTDELGLSFVRCTEIDQLPAFLGALDSLNHRHWWAEGLTGTFRRKPEEFAFYQRFTREALSRGWLRFFALRLGGEFKAIQIGYAYKGSFLQLQEGFDPNGPPGLGNVLRAKVIESCIREGLTTYDFLGQHTEHKRRWQAKVRPGCHILIFHRRPLSAALARAGVWPTGRFLRPRRLSVPCPAG